MQDIAGIGKALDAKTTQKLYADAVAPAAKQIGELSGDVLKAFRLFTAPLQLLAAAQDRFGSWLDAVRSRVPEERQVEAPANISGPVLMDLRFAEPTCILTELYLNLLARAIDKDRQDEAHPAFIKIIEHLSPVEAELLCVFHRTCSAERRSFSQTDPMLLKLVGCHCADPVSRLWSSLEHLRGLGLIDCVEWDFSTGCEDTSADIRLTNFGRSFIRACFPHGEGKQ